MHAEADPGPVLADRIARALKYAESGVYDGDHHKMWVVDQMVRALTGCPVVIASAVDACGEPYRFEAQGESEEYLKFVRYMGDWDEGIAP